MARVAYDGIYRDLKKQIEDGVYAYQSFLPSQSRLVDRYGCAHNTVRKALAQLASQGYCQPIHGKGVRVIWRPRNAPVPFVMGGLEPFAETVARNGIDAHTIVTTFETIVCGAALSAQTGFPEGMELLHADRVRVLDGTAAILDRSYFSAEAVRGLTREQAEQSIYTYVEENRGLKVATSKRMITVEPATDEDHALLDLGDIDYLAIVTSRNFDGSAIPFEYTQSRRHPGYFCFQDTAIRKH